MDDIDIGALDALDEGRLDIRHPKTRLPLGWVWTFYGPAHAATIALADRVSRDAMRRAVARRQAVLNGRQIEDEERSYDDIQRENVDNIIARTKGFSSVKLNGELLEFSPDKARELLLDRRKGWLIKQVLDYLGAEENFIQPSATS
ncbi:hypothetical protein [Bradyrhizobium cosmicum]|uniref:Branched-chain amino acid ABC transporter n=1 Tax=Bradyrhizobium cosmicum TaxID=1404864 RepID=A0AAI8MEL3_9BRAD|nr:hypothetical protein [Bradyrhizobium cosmicum]BAL77029.1 putative branched-chain amino acid ABC transporter [Bradyrhizobium cosmicum]